MKKIILTLAAVFMSLNMLAATVSVQNTSGNGSLDGAFTSLGNTLNGSGSAVAFLGGQDELATGLADTAHFATQSTSLMLFQNYDLFAISVGGGAAVASEGSLPDFLAKLSEDDAYGGVSGMASVNIGINLGLFVDNLYMNILFGGFPETPFGELTTKSSMFGVGFNYKLMDDGGSPLGGMKWRGISLGTGFYYASQEASYTADISRTATGSGATDVYFEPELDITTKQTVYVIPVEATTSFRALWILDIGVGAGADIAFGSSSIDVQGTAPIRLVTNDSQVGYATLQNADTKDGSPSVFKGKLLFGAGLSFGPVKLSANVAWYVYPVYSAYGGLSTSFVW